MALLAASAIAAASVTGTSGEALGSIAELMIDCDTGSVAYAVLSHGGVLGVGEKLFAVPWSAFTVDAVDGHYALDADPAALAAARGIGKDAWPAEAHADWIA